MTVPGPLAPPREVEWRGGAVMAGEEGSEERELWDVDFREDLTR